MAFGVVYGAGVQMYNGIDSHQPLIWLVAFHISPPCTFFPRPPNSTNTLQQTHQIMQQNEI